MEDCKFYNEHTGTKQKVIGEQGNTKYRGREQGNIKYTNRETLNFTMKQKNETKKGEHGNSYFDQNLIQSWDLIK